MAKTIVKKEICDACGAEVRPGSLFCYNCGGAVAEEAPAVTKKADKLVSDGWLKADLSENNDFKTTKLKPAEIADKPIEKPTVGELLEKIEDNPAEKTVSRTDAKMNSAASLRRKAKSFQRKKVEIVWEEPENAPNKWFPIVAIGLILFVAFIFYLAMYLK